MFTNDEVLILQAELQLQGRTEPCRHEDCTNFTCPGFVVRLNEHSLVPWWWYLRTLERRQVILPDKAEL